MLAIQGPHDKPGHEALDKLLLRNTIVLRSSNHPRGCSGLGVPGALGILGPAFGLSARVRWLFLQLAAFASDLCCKSGTETKADFATGGIQKQRNETSLVE